MKFMDYMRSNIVVCIGYALSALIAMSIIITIQVWGLTFGGVLSTVIAMSAIIIGIVLMLSGFWFSEYLQKAFNEYWMARKHILRAV